MKNRLLCWYNKNFLAWFTITMAIAGCFFYDNAFAREFNVKIKNDTEETLIISNIIKNYSVFLRENHIEKLSPSSETIKFSVKIYDIECLDSETLKLDGLYFESQNNASEKIAVTWGKIPDTGFTPIFGPVNQKSEIFETIISVEGISQNPTYVFTIKKISSKP